MARRAGRRPGKHDTRDTILSAARRAFAERGYDGASIRSIATSAGVDPALVHHYFGSKEQLFRAVVQPPIDPDDMLPHIFAGGTDGVPERLVHAFLSVWEGPVSGPAISSLVRSAVAHRRTGLLVREFFTTQIIRRLIEQLGDEIDSAEVPLRASLVASQLFGVALTRYILKLEPLAGVSQETVVAAVAPTIRRYLFEELAPGDRPDE